MTIHKHPRVLIIGAGFGGLNAAQSLADKNIDVILIDRHNYHVFTPLLYQVATASLDPSEIAYPVRATTHRWHNVKFQMGEIVAIDPTAKLLDIRVDDQVHKLAYDYLILACGSTTNFFGMQDVMASAHGIKDLNEAVKLRNHILKQIERAVWNEDREYRQASITLVVVGGGPTGIETAGALYELSQQILSELKRKDENLKLKVILIDSGDRLLKPYPVQLQDSTIDQLESLGVEVVLNDRLVEASDEHVRLKSGRVIKTKTLIWAAGVKGSPVGELLGVSLAPNGQVPVLETTEAIGLQNIYVVGDMASLSDDHVKSYPMLIQVAKQQGILAAENILRREAGSSQESFKYNDRGIMATIGRNRAVAWIYNRVPMTGFLAWFSWIFLHLVWLFGFRNRLNVLINWIWYYFAQDRAVRLIVEPEKLIDEKMQRPQ